MKAIQEARASFKTENSDDDGPDTGIGAFRWEWAIRLQIAEPEIENNFPIADSCWKQTKDEQCLSSKS